MMRNINVWIIKVHDFMYQWRPSPHSYIIASVHKPAPPRGGGRHEYKVVRQGRRLTEAVQNVNPPGNYHTTSV